MQGDRELVRAVMASSRALVAIAAAAIEEAPFDVTLAQFRAVVVLSTSGPCSMSGLGQDLGLSPSSTTRLVERLERKGLVERQPSPTSRRSTALHITADGTRLVAEVMAAREADVARVLERLPVEDRVAVRHAFEAFAVAAGEALDLALPTADPLGT